MTRLVFLDVGGHLGQSVEVALTPTWTFDQVHTFEPDPSYAQHIKTRFAKAIEDGRLIVHEAALSDRDGELTLFGDNEKGGASVVEGSLAHSGTPRSVRAIDVKRFVEGFVDSDRIYIKLNCEGGEVAILNRLCKLQSKANIAAIVADFDVVKTGFGFFKKSSVVRRAVACHLPVVLAERVMVGKTHFARLSNWLDHHPELAAVPGHTCAPRKQPLQRRIRYAMRDMRSAIGLSAPGYRRNR